jgi:hypothetical protein
MKSEVRKVLEAMREQWDGYSFYDAISDAERADAAKREEPVRKAVVELIDRWHWMAFAEAEYARRMILQIIAELNVIIATKHESQPATASGQSVTFGESPKATLPADEHIRAIAAQAVRDAMPDVLNGVADAIHGCGFTVGVNGLRKHADKLRKERGA